MEIKLYEKKEKKESEVIVAVRHDKMGISLVAVNEEGAEIIGGFLLTLKPNGKIKLYPNINSCLGFPHDDEGRLVLED